MLWVVLIRKVVGSFEICGVSADIAPQSWARLVASELHEKQISVSRLTHIWPGRPEPHQALGPARIVLVLQSDGAKEAALIFHKNERFLAYSCDKNVAALP